MNEFEMMHYISKIDPVDILIRADESRKYLEKGQSEDALAYAIAAGVKLGIKAVLENQGNQQKEK